MSKHPPAQHTERIAGSLLNPAGGPVDVLVLGAGRGGLAILEVLGHYDWVRIRALVDIDPEAPALASARQSGIRTAADCEHEVRRFDSGIIIDVSNDRTLSRQLKPMIRRRPIELISGKSARLLYDLVSEQLHSRKTIRTQNTRLDLLDSMLEITLLLESRPPLSEVANRSFVGIYSHVGAVRGLAVVFDSDEVTDVIGAAGVEEPFCDPAARRHIHRLYGDMAGQGHFMTLSQPIVLDPLAAGPGFNIMVPVGRGDDLAGALLFDVPGPLSHEQEAALSLASVHLNMAAKTLLQFQHLETMAIEDGLTGMFNRHYLDRKLREEIHRIKRMQSGSLTCAFIDIDNFKPINDSCGHQVGDMVLKQVAQSIVRCIRRDHDICARYGGDEFIILLPSTSREEYKLAEQMGLRLLEHISGIRIPDHPDLSITASIGMATQSSETLDEEMLLSMADNALYQSKRAGKCCLRIHADQQYHLWTGTLPVLPGSETEKKQLKHRPATVRFCPARESE